MKGMPKGRVAIVAWMCGVPVIIKGGYQRHNRAQQDVGEVKRFLARFGVDKVWVANDTTNDEIWLSYLWLMKGR